MQSRLTLNKQLLATPTRKTAWSNALKIAVQMDSDRVIVLERFFNGVEESDLKPQSYNTKSNLV